MSLTPKRPGKLRRLHGLRLREKLAVSLSLIVWIEVNLFDYLIYFYSCLRLIFPYIFGQGRACNYLQARINESFRAGSRYRPITARIATYRTLYRARNRGR